MFSTGVNQRQKFRERQPFCSEAAITKEMLRKKEKGKKFMLLILAEK